MTLLREAVPYDGGRFRLLRFRHALDEQRMGHRIRQILADGVPDAPPSKRSAGGDPRSLRGIPALSRGVGGAIAGTRPETDGTRG